MYPSFLNQVKPGHMNVVVIILLLTYLRAHYNVIMKAIEVGGDVLQLPTDTFDSGEGKGTIIDSGTTLAYLPDVVYESLMAKVHRWFMNP